MSGKKFMALDRSSRFRLKNQCGAERRVGSDDPAVAATLKRDVSVLQVLLDTVAPQHADPQARQHHGVAIDRWHDAKAVGERDRLDDLDHAAWRLRRQADRGR